MKTFLLLGLICVLTAPNLAYAGEVTPFEECANLRNMTDQTIMGVVRTAPFKATTGNVQRHEGSFRLEPDEMATICSKRAILRRISCRARYSHNYPAFYLQDPPERRDLSAENGK